MPLAAPIAVQAGDVLGVVVTPKGGSVGCQFKGGSLTAGDINGLAQVAPTVGTSFTFQHSIQHELVNVAATLVEAADVSVSERALPAAITAGGEGVFQLTASNNGPSQTPITVTDTIPSGLAIQSVVAGTSPCSVSGQDVSCTLSGAGAGAGTVAVVVSAANVGTYTNIVKAKGIPADSNAANNSASATLTVTAAPVGVPPATSHCQVIPLSKVPLAEAKSVLSVLGCSVGKITSKRSRSVPKGDVISTSPGAGATLHPLGTRVAIVTSKGKPKKRHHRKHRRSS